METHYTFAVETCGYSTVLSGNSRIRMVMKSRTVICLDCVLVVDIVSDCADWYMKDAPVSRSSLVRCPVCGGVNLEMSCAVTGERESLFPRSSPEKETTPEGARAGLMRKNGRSIEPAE